MRSLTFGKYEGLGNDFIVVDAATEWLEPELAVKLCDRHFGVGADGVLLVLPPSSLEARARMVVLNADGSRPEMCGNGLRCVALHLALADDAVAATYGVETDAGLRGCEVERDADRAEVAIDMGRGAPLGTLVAKVDGRSYDFARISMGNPHAITFDAPLEPALADQVGPRVSALIEGGSNVEFARLTGANAIELVVWERGVGRTLACGTGAVATVLAAALAGRVAFGEPVEVSLPGGALEVIVADDTLGARLRGPARRVFRGELELT
ncbi:MAG: diaminopimelate epimerase [Sorangiineae bacterium]|nr:diaminopimelate epimerase [Polyangiaceae bacterium]MEB2321476.1 diaminopimelate epimerase [Sorangiineae bacterium]